jgi:lactoylglutathione lyase
LESRHLNAIHGGRGSWAKRYSTAGPPRQSTSGIGRWSHLQNGRQKARTFRRTQGLYPDDGEPYTVSRLRKVLMKVQKLLHTRMRVSDMDETIGFYTAILGLEVMERKVSPRGSQLAFLKVPNSEELIELCSFPASGPVKVQEDLVHLAFEVDNLDDTMASLNSRNIKITDGPTRTSSGSRFIFIDAPDGYEIELIERPPGTAIV